MSGGSASSFFSVTKINNFPYFCRAVIFFLAFLTPCLFTFGTSQSGLICDKHVTLSCYLHRLAAHKQLARTSKLHVKILIFKTNPVSCKRNFTFQTEFKFKIFTTWSLVLFSIGMRTLIYNKHNFPLCPALK